MSEREFDVGSYAEWDAIDCARNIRLGNASASDVLDAAFEIIERLDPDVNAIVSLQRDQAYRQIENGVSGPLAGVPIALKDCVGLICGVNRDFGSRLATGSEIDFDEEVIARMMASGLVPMATTNVPEFSSSVTTESVLHGPCRNPWNRNRSAGGSSGGAAAAVAYGAVPVAYGNDAAGSIRIPASCCGLFGFKPSRGRVPTGPVYSEFWFGLMVHHVITKSVRDSALILDLTEGADSGAPYGIANKLCDYSKEVERAPGRLRIAISDGSDQGFSIAGECIEAIDSVATLLRDLGHDVEAISPSYSGAEILDDVTTILAVSLANEIEQTAIQNARPIDASTVEHCNLALMERGRNVSAIELARVLDRRNNLSRVMGRFFERYDLLLTPTLADLPIEIGKLNSDSTDLDAYLQQLWSYSPFTPLANVCGIPSMSVPLHWTDCGLPVGVMFTSRYSDEATLLRIASQLEKAAPWRHRRPPVHGARK